MLAGATPWVTFRPEGSPFPPWTRTVLDGADREAMAAHELEQSLSGHDCQVEAVEQLRKLGQLIRCHSHSASVPRSARRTG